MKDCINSITPKEVQMLLELRMHRGSTFITKVCTTSETRDSFQVLVHVYSSQVCACHVHGHQKFVPLAAPVGLAREPLGMAPSWRSIYEPANLTPL